MSNFILKALNEVVDETNRIQPANLKKINPLQIDVLDWKAIRNQDKKFNKENGTNVNSGKDFSQPSVISKAIIDKVQKELTQTMKDKTGIESFSVEDLEKQGKLGTGAQTLFKNREEKEKKPVRIENGVYGDSFTYGNKKLPPSTLIINIIDALNCPSVCDMKDVCYAAGSERQYANVQLRNMRNNRAFHTLSVRDIVKWIETYIEQAKVRINQIRISEDGDFENQEQVDFADKLAGHFEKKYGIKTTCYTHRFDLNFKNCKHMIVNNSVYASNQGDRRYLACSDEMYATLEDDKIGVLTKDNIPHIETPKQRELDTKFKNKLIGEPYFKCCCDCYLCNFCYQTREENGETGGLTNVICKVH